MTIVRETIQVSGVRCERCVMRLGATLEGHDGLELANVNLMGELQVAYDDQRTSREALVAALARGGFRELDTF
jgi:copper chaperone CopZ